MDAVTHAASPTTPQADLRYLKGVGPKKALVFEKIGIHSIRDLLYYFPRRYEDRSKFERVCDLKAGTTATISVEIVTAVLRRFRKTALLEVTATDNSGMIRAVWFNQAYLQARFKPGVKVIFYGKIEHYQNRLQMISPEHEILEPGDTAIHTGRITPIYPLSAGLFQRSLRCTVWHALEVHLAARIQEFLPVEYIQHHNLLELSSAIHEIHFPTSSALLEKARERLVHDELFLFELRLLTKMHEMKSKYLGYPLSGYSEILERFQTLVPFTLTSGQMSAISQISEDCAAPHPMNRLLQGDVGSGKTAVAAFALMLAVHNNTQGAILAPTELLAEQHFHTLRNWFEPAGIRIGLFTAGVESDTRSKNLALLKSGKLQIAVGTHALFQEDIRFHRLAMIVIDEQHRFGVHQRCLLLNREPRPHQLVMTATPIPRTLALTSYGDLETSVMKDRPKGRNPIETFWVTRKKQPQILQGIKEKILSGEQAYFILPVIDETEKSDMLAATQTYDFLRSGPFKGLQIGLVHGRMPREDRASVMLRFRRGEINILVATSVIEVGVDNPNATVMVIENAERFGLSQLHQMRGRIGRGSKPSVCFLFGEPKTDQGKMRLRIMTKTHDGFVIAEEDLKLRGPGDFWGSRQSGDPLFALADPIKDYDILYAIRQRIVRLIDSNQIHNPPWQRVLQHLQNLPLRY